MCTRYNARDIPLVQCGCHTPKEEVPVRLAKMRACALMLSVPASVPTQRVGAQGVCLCVRVCVCVCVCVFVCVSMVPAAHVVPVVFPAAWHEHNIDPPCEETPRVCQAQGGPSSHERRWTMRPTQPVRTQANMNPRD